MEREQIRQLIYQELPQIMREDAELQQFILQLARPEFAGKEKTENRFDRVLAELQRDREEQRERWQQNDARWQENQETIKQILAEIQRLDKKHDSTIGALGARWGLHSEAAFRNGLRGILQNSFAVEVLHVTEFDDSGEVFGRPEQIELALIVLNGTLIIAEIKSAMSQADMYIFARKAAFYEKLHQREANRKLIISPMVDERAHRAAQKLGIEVFSYAGDVDL